MAEALFNRFSIIMTEAEAESASHRGNCDVDVDALAQQPHISEQLRSISQDDLIAELREYGAWDDDELADSEQNLRRILWIAAGNINADRGEVSISG